MKKFKEISKKISYTGSYILWHSHAQLHSEKFHFRRVSWHTYTVFFCHSREGAEVQESSKDIIHTDVFSLQRRYGIRLLMLFIIRFYFIHFSRLNSISIILFWENTGNASENYEVFEISNHSCYSSM